MGNFLQPEQRFEHHFGIGMAVAPRIFLEKGAAARVAAERRAERLIVVLVDAALPRLRAQRGGIGAQILDKILSQVLSQTIGQVLGQILGQIFGQVRFKGHVRAPCAFPKG